MARIFKIGEIEARKKALAAESEVYRQMLRLEIQNLRLYNARTQRKFATLRSIAPMLLVGAPLFRTLFRRRNRSGWSKLLSGAIYGWRLYKQTAPLWQQFFGNKTGTSQRGPPESAREREQGANI